MSGSLVIDLIAAGAPVKLYVRIRRLAEWEAALSFLTG